MYTYIEENLLYVILSLLISVCFYLILVITDKKG
jgi:hypothetical protein